MNTPLHVQLAELKIQWNTIERLERVALDQKKKAGELARVILNRILDGETTRDAIKDATIITCHRENDEIEAKFRTVQDAVAGKQGQYIFIVFRRETYESGTLQNLHAEGDIHTLTLEPSPRLEQWAYAAKLIGESLILDRTGAKPLCALPTAGYLSLTFNGRDVLIADSFTRNLPLSTVIMDLDRPLAPKGRENVELLGRDAKQVELLVGNEKIKTWFDTYDGGAYTHSYPIIVAGVENILQTA